MRTRVTLLVAVLLGSFSPAVAQFSGTPQEQAACRPDARKHCSRVSQDEMTVLNCLIRNRTRLSQSCRALLQRHGQLPPSR
jgi:Cysteine rich repeat